MLALKTFLLKKTPFSVHPVAIATRYFCSLLWSSWSYHIAVSQHDVGTLVVMVTWDHFLKCIPLTLFLRRPRILSCTHLEDLVVQSKKHFRKCFSGERFFIKATFQKPQTFCAFIDFSYLIASSEFWQIAKYILKSPKRTWISNRKHV